MSEHHSPSELPPARVLPPRQQWTLLAVGAGVLVVIGVLWLVLARVVHGEPAPPAAAPGPSQAVKLSEAQLKAMRIEEVRTLTFRTERVTDGTIALNDDTTTPVFSPYSGRVTRLFAKPGDVVRQGAPLFEVDASEAIQGESDVVSAAAGLKSARIQLDIAQDNEHRQHELFLANAGAKRDWQQSQADLAAAESATRTAEIALASARNRLKLLGRPDAEIAAIEDGRAAPSASARSIVTAPIAGTVTQRQVGIGQYIVSAASGASSPVYSISNLETLWLIANLREADAPLARVGQSVDVHVLAFPERTFSAKLTWVAPAVDPNTHRLPVRAEIKNDRGLLKPMMFARFAVAVGAEGQAPGIPERAIVYEGSSAHVWVLGPGNSLTSRSIQTGRTHDDVIEVVSGLSPGEKVITSGNLFIDRAAEGDL